MTLSDRERFILHTMSVMVVDSMIKKFKDDDIDDICLLYTSDAADE